MGDIGVTRALGVVQLVLDAPQRRNALSRKMLAALAAAIREADDDVTAIVISGAGSTFSAGADFAEITGTSADVDYDDAVAAVSTAIIASPRLVIAALEGPCLGAAVELALACDVRVAGEGSYLQVPAVRLGLLYNPEAVARMTARLPTDTARRLLLVAERFDAEAALQARLVSHVAPHGGAVGRALELADRVAPADLPALAATKGLLNDLGRPPHAEFWESRRRELLDSPARREAVAEARRRHIDPKP